MSCEPTTATPQGLMMELFSQCAGSGDIDGLTELYDVAAVFQPKFGVALAGHEQIRPVSEEFLALRPQITYTADTDVLIVGDIALVSNFWTMGCHPARRHGDERRRHQCRCRSSTETAVDPLTGVRAHGLVFLLCSPTQIHLWRPPGKETPMPWRLSSGRSVIVSTGSRFAWSHSPPMPRMPPRRS